MTSPYLPFSLKIPFHILYSLGLFEADPTVQELGCQSNYQITMAEKEKQSANSAFQGGACTLFSNTKLEWALLNTLRAPRCSAQYIEMYYYWLCQCGL